MQGSILHSLKIINLHVICNKGLNIIKHRVICFRKKNYDGPWGSWCSRQLQVLASESYETNNIHGVSSNQFTMLSIAILTCWDMELNNAILRQTGQIMLLLGTQGATGMHTVIHDPPLVTLVSYELRWSLSVAPMHKMIQTLPMRTCQTNNKSTSRERGEITQVQSGFWCSWCQWNLLWTYMRNSITQCNAKYSEK